QLRDDVIAHAIVIRAPERMRPLRDLLDVPYRALGGEHGVRSRGGNRTRRPSDSKNRECAEDDDTERDSDSFQHPAPVAKVEPMLVEIDARSTRAGTYSLPLVEREEMR